MVKKDIDQAEIEMKIKSKTNAAYRMISLLNKHKLKNSGDHSK